MERDWGEFDMAFHDLSIRVPLAKVRPIHPTGLAVSCPALKAQFCTLIDRCLFAPLN